MSKVLLVEDEVDLADVIEVILEEEGFTVIKASNSHDAREKFNQNRPDIVISDVNIPGENGFTLVGDIKDEAPQTRCIIITGAIGVKSGPPAPEKKSVQADYILTKPLDFDEFIKLLKQLAA